MQLISCISHPLHFYNRKGEHVRTVNPSGYTVNAKIGKRPTFIDDATGLSIYVPNLRVYKYQLREDGQIDRTIEPQRLPDLPPQSVGVYYIVHLWTLRFLGATRSDLLGQKGPVKDENGKIIGYRGMIKPLSTGGDPRVAQLLKEAAQDNITLPIPPAAIVSLEDKGHTVNLQTGEVIEGEADLASYDISPLAALIGVMQQGADDGE